MRSGGPKMTVTKVGATTLRDVAVWCTWFDGPKKYEEVFDPNALEKC